MNKFVVISRVEIDNPTDRTFGPYSTFEEAQITVEHLETLVQRLKRLNSPSHSIKIQEVQN